MFKKALFVLLILSLFSTELYAQFGKNNVRYDHLDQVYQSYRFDIHHNLDLDDPAQKAYLDQVAANLENASDWMSSYGVFNYSIEERIPVLFYKTHHEMETSNLVGGFMPEGVGAFVESFRYRMVLKADFSRPLGRAIGVHELAHEFQFAVQSRSIVEKIIDFGKFPSGYYEGCAEYLAGLYDPHTRGDLRRREQIMYASNPRMLPTWPALKIGANNPYTMWSMVPEFLEEKFSIGIDFCTEPLRGKKGLGEFIYDKLKGEIGDPDINSEKFDQQSRYYWGTEKGFELYRINHPKPYEENDNFRGRTITPHGHPYPMRSAVLSPDGSKYAAFTIQNNGVSLVVCDIPEEWTYKTEEERKKENNILSRLKSKPKPNSCRNLTPQLPPIPWEYIIAQGFETWPFNGFDVSWSKDSEHLAFFARINRDHALVIVNAETGKIYKKIELENPSLDQAFSPAFSSDGKKIYFSAARNISRDLYSIDIETREVVNLTNDGSFATAPAVSPDGSRIAYIDFEEDFQHLFLLSLEDGKKEQLTFGRFNDSSPSWSDDGSTLVYVSDEIDMIFNIYTFDLATRKVTQRSPFMGGADTPVFARNSLDTVYYAVFRDDDQYETQIYPNFEIFEIKFKKPIRDYIAVDNNEPTDFIFNPNRDLFKFELDKNQLLNPIKPSNQWKCSGGGISVGLNTYYGMFGQSYVGCSNLLETKQHLGQFAMYGSLRLFDYTYRNQEKRTNWQWGAHHQQMPLFYQYYDIVKRYPKQQVLNNAWSSEWTFDLFTQHPLNKFNRWELFSKLRHRSYNVFGLEIGNLDENVFEITPGGFTESDVQMYRFLKNSNGSNLSFGAAYVRDTVLYSNNSWGPFHGNALRAQVEFAPAIGSEFQGFNSVNLLARMYRHLGSSSVFASRAEFMATTRANGDFVLLCGPDRLRGCEYGSVAGNQVGYLSTELRFPVPGTYILFTGVRGFLFADAAFSRFSNESFPIQKLKAYGFGAQFILPLIGLPAQSVWTRDNGKWKPTFYINLHW